MRKIAFAALVAIVLPACLGSDFADSVESSWQLSSGTHEGQAVPMFDTHPVTLNLNSGEITGTAACNGYGGRYELSGSSFSITEGLAVTEMACQPEEVMDSERVFLEAIANVDTVELTNDGLLMTGPGTELSFTTLD